VGINPHPIRAGADDQIGAAPYVDKADAPWTRDPLDPRFEGELIIGVSGSEILHLVTPNDKYSSGVEELLGAESERL
jgi:hypothetical protein